MKRVIQSSFVILLSVLIFLGGGRFTIGKMVCGGGKTVYSFGNAKDCCEKKDTQEESVESSCCKLINVSYSLDSFFHSFKISAPASQLVYVLPVFEFKFQDIAYTPAVFYPDLPPPDTKDILHVFCSLLL